MSDLIQNPFESALAQLGKSGPPEIAFEVSAHLFRDLASFDVANKISRTMEDFKFRATQCGYVVTTTYMPTGFWQYHLRKGPDGPTKLLYVAPPIPELKSLPIVYETHGLDTQERVCFYEQDYYVLSNFSSFTVVWKGIKFDTSEAAYHWEKFNSKPWSTRNSIQTAISAHEAFKIAERFKSQRRPDWNEVKVGIMCEILWEKVRIHEYVRRKLLATGSRELVENSWRDDFWGWGADKQGLNMLGKLWMGIRDRIQADGGRVCPPGWARPSF
jgi:ribA/ribD-fused uncharacterized protein